MVLARGGRFAPRQFSRLATEQNNSKKPPQWRQIRVHNGRRSSSPSPFLLAPTPKALRHPLRRGHLLVVTDFLWARAPPCACRRRFWRAAVATNPRRALPQMICGIIRAPAPLPTGKPSAPTPDVTLRDLAVRRRIGSRWRSAQQTVSLGRRLDFSNSACPTIPASENFAGVLLPPGIATRGPGVDVTFSSVPDILCKCHLLLFCDSLAVHFTSYLYLLHCLHVCRPPVIKAGLKR